MDIEESAAAATAAKLASIIVTAANLNDVMSSKEELTREILDIYRRCLNVVRVAASAPEPRNIETLRPPRNENESAKPIMDAVEQ